MSKNGYDVYMKKCLLPIAPQKLQIKINNANKTITLIDEGEVNLLKKAGLTDIDFECTIPQVKYPFAVYKSGFKGASYFLEYFETLKTKKKPFQFIVSRSMPNGKTLFSTNIKVTLEDYTITEQAKQGFDVTVKISLKQWRKYGTKTVKIKVDTTKATSSTTTTTTTATKTETRSQETSPAPAQNQTYTVVSGDCLWNIAKKFYGNGAKYMTIYNANSSVFKGRSPNLIYVGEVLTIPAA